MPLTAYAFKRIIDISVFRFHSAMRILRVFQKEGTDVYETLMKRS